MKEKGVSLLFSIFLFTILLGISLGISHFATRQIQMLRETGYSVNAFYAADSGVEKAMLNIFVNNSCPTNGTNPDYVVYFECKNSSSCNTSCNSPQSLNCQAPNFCLKVIGTYSGVSQAIQIEY